MERITEKSPAKINLFLKIINKRKDGYHNLRSGITLVNLFDNIYVKKSRSFNINYIGKFAPSNNKFKDCIIEKIFNKLEIKRPNYEFTIVKNIPVQSGLGSASSNAAAVLRILLRLKLIDYNKKIDYASLGSDIPLFLNQKDCLIRGRGEKIINKHFPKYYFLIVKPLTNCSTKEIYRKIHIKDINFDQQNDINEFTNFDIGNDLEKIVFTENIEVRNIFIFLKNIEGVIFTRMTGSGSSCFAAFGNLSSAKKAKSIFNNSFPKLWNFIAENNINV